MSFPGYVRLYDDRSSYTGVHKNGGPTTIDAHRVDLKDHLDRSPADMRGVKVGLARSSLNRASSSPNKNTSLNSSFTSTRSLGSNLSPDSSLDRASSSPNRGTSLNSSFTFDRSESSRRLMRSASGREVADTRVSRAASGRNLTTTTPAGGRRTATSKDLMTFKDLKRTRSGTLLCVHNKVKTACIQCGGWAGSAAKSTSPAKNEEGQMYGPERFYYDRSTWGGTHKRGGPSTIDSFRVDLSQHLDRSEADVRGVKTGRTRDDIREAVRGWGGSARDVAAIAGMRPASAAPAPSAGGEAGGGGVWGKKEVILEEFPAPIFPGYVRHYHDKSTYTGVHKNGGPSTVDAFTIDMKRHVTRGASAKASAPVWDHRGFVGVSVRK